MLRLAEPDLRPERVHVVVEPPAIAGVIPASEPPPPADEVLDGGDRLVTPGLVDAHTHLYQAYPRDLFDDLPLAEWLEHVWSLSLSPTDAYDSTLLGAAEAIRGGTTCVSDMVEEPGRPVDEQVGAISDSGLRATVAMMVSDVAEGAATPVLAATEALAESRAFVERWHGSRPGLAARLGPVGLPACTEELYRGARALADELGVGIHTHCAEGRAQTEASRSRFGMGETEALVRWGVAGDDTQLAHSIWLDEAEIGLLARSGAHVVHCPTSNLKLGDGVAPVVALRRSGVPVALGTDGAASSGSHDLLQEARTASLVQRAITGDPGAVPPTDAYRALTSVGAAAVGFGSEVGRLEPGFQADLALWDLSGPHMWSGPGLLRRFLAAARGGDCTDSMVRGRWLLRDRRIVAFDEGALRGRVAEALPRLARRIGLPGR